MNFNFATYKHNLKMEPLPLTLYSILMFLVKDQHGRVGCLTGWTTHPDYHQFQNACCAIAMKPYEVQSTLLEILDANDYPRLSYFKNDLLNDRNYIKKRFDKAQLLYNELMDKNMLKDFEYEWYIIKELWLSMHH